MPTLAHLKESLERWGSPPRPVLRLLLLFVAPVRGGLAARDQGLARLAARPRPARGLQAAVCYLLVAALVFWGNLGGGNSMYFKF